MESEYEERRLGWAGGARAKLVYDGWMDGVSI